MNKPHRAGIVAVFISCEDRERLDRIKIAEEKRTGYPLTLKAILSRALKALEK